MKTTDLQDMAKLNTADLALWALRTAREILESSHCGEIETETLWDVAQTLMERVDALTIHGFQNEEPAPDDFEAEADRIRRLGPNA